MIPNKFTNTFVFAYKTGKKINVACHQSKDLFKPFSYMKENPEKCGS